jgi:3-hydroxybutyryl-CoA dehydrogenase
MSAPRIAAVVGTGYMGTGFAQLLALGGLDVRVTDADAERAAVARDRAVTLARRFEELGLMEAGSASRVDAGVRAAPSIADAVADADIVFEAVTEDVAVKWAVLETIEAAARSDAILTTNTSAIPIRVLASRLRRPERFLGTHWFNPAQWVPAVEVIPGESTTQDVVDTAMALLEAIGKDPVVVGDGPGFVANRIQFAMFREAALLVEEGIADAADVDRVVRSSFGFRLPFFGPFTIADMAGLDVYAGAFATLEEEFGPRFSAPRSLTGLVAGGHIGTKHGGGFLLPEANGTDAAVEERRDRLYCALDEIRKAEED